MYVTPEALQYAAGLVEREWGSSGYHVERIEGSHSIAAVFVAHFDGSRFVIVANAATGAWASAEGETDQTLALAMDRMERARYIGGSWVITGRELVRS